MALNCTKLDGSSYHLMLKYEKLFSGNCTQFSSQLLNCPRCGAHVSPSSPENSSMQQLLPHPNSCWRLSCTRLGKVEALETKIPENVLTNSQDSHTEAQRDQPVSGEGNPDHRFLGWLGTVGQFPCHSLGSTARTTVDHQQPLMPALSYKLMPKLPAICLPPFPKIPLQQGCCLQSKAQRFSVAVHVHVGNFSPQTSFEENKIVIKQA